MSEKQARIAKYVLYAALLLAVGWMMLTPTEGADYRRYVTDTLRYERATVVEVVSEELSDSLLGTGQQLGQQTLLVRFSNGETVTVENYLTDTHNVYAKAGQKVIICEDAPKNVTPYYTVYNYDRLPGLLALVITFFALMLLIGGRKGFDAVLAILFTLVFLLRVTLPRIYSGGSPLLYGLVTVVLSTAVTMLLIHGFSKHAGIGFIVTMLGECAACGLFWSFSSLLHLTGFQSDSADGLLLIARSTGLQVHTLLFAGMMLASLGAVMDVSVSILSALREVALAGSRGRGRLFSAGMNIGRDMIGTMSNTLIFAFAGGALVTMLVFYSCGVQPQQLISSDYLSVELAQGLCSTAAVIITVPAGALIGAATYGGENNAKSRTNIESSGKIRGVKREQ